MPLGDELKALADGIQTEDGCREAILDGLAEIIAGEDIAKQVLFYSGLTTRLLKKLPVFLMGKSQRGKSFCMTQVGSLLFARVFEDITSMSPKTIYYETKQKGNPALYKNKIALLDEFNDRPDDLKTFVKMWISHKGGPLRHKTVDTKAKEKFLEFEVEGVPVFWTNSMELVEDVGNQIHNRFFKLNVDENLAQSKTVEEWQIQEETTGSAIDPRVLRKGQMAVDYILERGDFQILNPFAAFITQKDYSVFNRRPMLNALLGAVTYSNWRWRPSYEVEDRKILLASLWDNLKALELWNRNEVYQQLAIPDYLKKVLDVLDLEFGLTKVEIATAYREKHGQKISAGTCYNYAKKLEEKDLATSKHREDDDGKSRGLEWTSTMSTITSVELDPALSPEKLADRLRLVFVEVTLPSTIDPEEEIARIIPILMDADIPTKEFGTGDKAKQGILEV